VVPAAVVPATLATVRYEGATPGGVLDALRGADVISRVDVRAGARSRRPGFAKTSLAAALADAGTGYRQLRGRGTPANGRAAARAGRQAAMHTIDRAPLATPGAQADLVTFPPLARE